MITIFNRKRLLIEVSDVETNKIKEKLEEKGIECTCKIITNKARGEFNNAVSKDVKYMFYIYVKNKDYDKSIELLSLEVC